eukprot:gb/GECH01000205.1/.p1 GENE.gb/GECH01000205.1/~~gb/GECH01000205.1/.p1  ORF type:complete len:332 (+),score=71.30 gb/GECH01000205.1/:1-996(+)
MRDVNIAKKIIVALSIFFFLKNFLKVNFFIFILFILFLLFIIMSSKKAKSTKKRDKKPFGVTELLDNFLFLGSGWDGSSVRQLKSQGITYVLNVASEWKDPTRYTKDMSYKHVYMKDIITQNIIEHFDECFQFIDEAKKRKEKILIHCVMGKSRSVSVIIGYVITRDIMNFKEAYHYIKTRRPIRLNMGFIEQLLQFEEQTLGQVSFTDKEIDQLKQEAQPHDGQSFISTKQMKKKNKALQIEAANEFVAENLPAIEEETFPVLVKEHCSDFFVKDKIGTFVASIDKILDGEDLKHNYQKAKKSNELLEWKEIDVTLRKKARNWFMKRIKE